jgi:integrase/recombinase XerC/integrase/recombinase XerD
VTSGCFSAIELKGGQGTVRRITQRAETPTLGEAIAAYLATLDYPETAGTRRVYASTLRQLREHIGAAVAVATLDQPVIAERLAGWFGDRWGSRAPATFNRNLDAIRSALGYWQDQDWITTDPTRALRLRGRAPDRTRALSKTDIRTLLAREDLGLRERVLWRMLYETAARASEVLRMSRPPWNLGGGPMVIRRRHPPWSV